MTHPFHPLCGQSLPVLFSRRRGGDVVLVCAGGVLGRVTVPRSWTDRGDPRGRLSVRGWSLSALDTLVKVVGTAVMSPLGLCDGTHKMTELAGLSVRALRARRRRLAAGLSDVETLLRGRLVRQGRRCGKPGCRCAGGELHGPYTYLRCRGVRVGHG